jgi:glutamate-ammonia-ligase adenylyltransferase
MHEVAEGISARALAQRICEAPVASAGGRGARELAAVRELASADPSLAPLSQLLAEPHVAAFVAGCAEGSSYITGLIQRDAAGLQRVLASAPEERFEALRAALAAEMARAASMAEAMSTLRRFKAEVALLTALADLAGAWPVMQVTAVLTATADAALREAVRFLFRTAAARGDWHPPDPAAPELQSGYIVLGMGKYGAHELNYSSDIDLIVFFAPERARLHGGLELQSFFVRFTRDLVRLMHERTGEGYVFRTDLRLRPDAGATQIALSTAAALHYYEAFGQNWERAALIKARPVAGDIEAGRMLLSELAPFVWRKHLDFAAIADIHAMKRQIHAFRGLGGIAVAGHDIKLGRGGIREIEFFAQTQQLIAGGRQRDLRVPQTLAALARLAERGWIKAAVAGELEQAYLFLRRIEHRVQMVADEQTHELPEDAGALASFARFCGYGDLESFSRDLVARLETVQRHYAALFEDMPELTAGGVNMVFAGEEDDPATIEALAGMGYSQPSQVIATVRGWHHGRYPAVRSARARERLTEVQPLLVAALADTADPDRAFASFDRFLAELPAGVQLFALLRANPGLLRLVADIMGTAPRLARILSRRRRLLDAVLDPRTLATPSAAQLDEIIAAELSLARDFQEVLDHARVVGSEQIFLIGVRVLTRSINASQAGGAYALLAERLIAALQREVERELASSHGRVPGGAAAVVAMGKLGGREMTAASDLDLIVAYEFAPDAAQSDGARPLAPTQYYARLTQRLVTALASPTPEGTLYDVDLRLRPSGQMGPVATQLSSFLDYQANEAWTWEHLALTRARVLTGTPAFRARVEAAIRAALVRPRDRVKIARDVRDMRQRIWAEKGTDSIWDLKQVRGGLVDIEFIAQHLQLVHAATHPEVLDQNTAAALHKLADAGLLEREAADVLIPATRLLSDLTQVLRLCLEGRFDPAAAPHGLKELLARAADAPTFPALEQRLRDALGAVSALFDRLVV